MAEFEKLRCRRCRQFMVLDDEDFHFKGCTDKYYYCPQCSIGAVEKIRYGKPVKVVWNFDE